MHRASACASETRLRELVETHFDVLWRLLRRLGVPESDVDDAVQEVIVVVARRIDEVQRGSERAFVLSTGCRVASTFRRTLRRRRETNDDELAELVDACGDPESLLQQRRARELLDEVLGGLPMELRTVFVLYELERFTCAEIAETLSIPPGTAASRLRRARAAFASAIAALEPRGLADPLPSHSSASRGTP
jgi:RNA polymerase sigma-70 factor (ECF subfamily)